jgi:2-(1,2-epoxy-1,2-dihydrophenyl)acetyl-CoA isomerase
MCDIRFAAEGARLGEAYARVGLIPGAGGAYFLPRLVGPAKALELLWTGDNIDAREAERIGLVNRVFADDELPSKTREFAERLVNTSPLAVRLIKRVMYQSLDCDLRTSLDLVASSMPLVRGSEDHVEAVSALREKRAPAFKGR